MKFRKPFYRKNRKRWVVQLDGKQINLGPDRAAAFEKYKQLIADRKKKASAEPASKVETGSVITVLDAFLDWLQNRVTEGTRGQRTFAWYRKYLQSFVKFRCDEFAGAKLPVARLEPFHVYQWVDSHVGWRTGKRGAMIAVQRAFNWAAKAGLLNTIGGRSPLANLEKPAPGRREQLVTENEYREIMTVIKCPQARDLVELSWETGMRPQELFTAESCFFEPEHGRIVFPVKLSKGKKVQRVVYLGDKALEIVKRAVLKHPDGPMLRNADGKPWCGSAVNCLFQRVRRELGRRCLLQAGLMPPKIPRLKQAGRDDPAVRTAHEEKVLARRKLIHKLAWEYGTKYSLYAIRHAFCTEALENGIDAVTVSVLMGHQDTTMVSRHYSHVHQRHEHMRAAANRARGA